MPEYICTWDITIQADTLDEAATKADEYLREHVEERNENCWQIEKMDHPDYVRWDAHSYRYYVSPGGIAHLNRRPLGRQPLPAETPWYDL